MQSRHRKMHRLMWIILGPLALAALIYAIVHRIKMPVMDKIPGADGKETSQ